jgi:hypothetical protein
MPEKPLTMPWAPAVRDEYDVMAVKAMAAGNASESQQKRVLDWIMFNACGLRDLSFRPGVDGDRATAFAEGKRHVGLQLAKLVTLPVALLEPKQKVKDGRRQR